MKLCALRTFSRSSGLHRNWRSVEKSSRISKSNGSSQLPLVSPALIVSSCKWRYFLYVLTLCSKLRESGGGIKSCVEPLRCIPQVISSPHLPLRSSSLLSSSPRIVSPLFTSAYTHHSVFLVPPLVVHATSCLLYSISSYPSCYISLGNALITKFDVTEDRDSPPDTSW